MYKYTCFNSISDKGLSLLADGYQRCDDVKDADCIMVRSKKMHDMDIPDNVMAVARAGAGTNNIPLDEYAKRGIFVFNTPGANATSVKELVFAGMYLASRDVIGAYQWCVEHANDPDIKKNAEDQKKLFSGSELAGKKLGVIGLGAIGVRVATEATHMDMEVYGYDPYISVNAAWNLSRKVSHVEKLDEIMSICDYITIHVPLIDKTQNMISRKYLEQMKPGSVLLNFSRDAIVDEEAVVELLVSGKIRKYVSDFPNPTVAGVPGVILTPHMGATTREAEENCAIMAAKEIKEFMERGNTINCVNLPNVDMGALDTAARICMLHKNRKGFIAEFSKIFDEEELNVSDMTNTNNGEYAYSVVDIDSPVGDAVEKKLGELNDMIKVRVIRNEAK